MHFLRCLDIRSWNNRAELHSLQDLRLEQSFKIRAIFYIFVFPLYIAWIYLEWLLFTKSSCQNQKYTQNMCKFSSIYQLLPPENALKVAKYQRNNETSIQKSISLLSVPLEDALKVSKYHSVFPFSQVVRHPEKMKM